MIGKLLAIGIGWLESEGWTFNVVDRTDGRSYTRATYSGNNSKFELVLDANEEKDLFFVYAYYPSNIIKDGVPAVSELVNRINFSLGIGNFEFDLDDGVLRYKTSVDVEASELTPTMVGNMVSASLATSDRYFNAVMQVCYGGKTPLEALRAMEEALAPETADEARDQTYPAMGYRIQ